MKNVIKASFYTSIGLLFTTTSALAKIDIWETKVIGGIRWSENSADAASQNLLQNILLYMGILAVFYLVWGWFNMLTAWGDEEKVKKWKTVIIQAAIWIVIITLAYSVVSWLTTVLTWI
jgi:hypothetical protein